MHLRQAAFTYSAYGKKRKNKKNKETGASRYIYQNKLDKACFPHDMAHRDFKDLNRRRFLDKVLRYIAFNIAKDPKYDSY